MERKYSKLLVITTLSLLCINLSFGQEKDYTLAKVGKKIHEAYIFFGCEPYYKYTFIETIKVKINWTGTYYESFEKIIKKAQKKNSTFNGIIFQTSDLSKADLIRFVDLGSTRGGFSIGSKVSFIEMNQVFVGEIVELESSKGKATVKFLNVFDENEIKKFDNKKLTPINNDIFQKNLQEIKSLTEKFKFIVGDKVSWIDNNVLGKSKKQLTGEIINLDNKSHKASIKYLNADKQEEIAKVSFMNLTKTTD